MVRIYSDAGQLVRELPLGPQDAGLSNFSWDGTLANGQTAPAGRYSMTAAIESRAGDTALATYVGIKGRERHAVGRRQRHTAPHRQRRKHPPLAGQGSHVSAARACIHQLI